MAAQVGTIAVKIAAKTAEFTRGVDAASRRLNKISAAAASVSKKSAIAFAAIGVALSVVSKAADKQLKAERQLQNAFKQTGAALDMEKMKSFASALQGITLTGDEATLQMAAMLAPFGLLQNDIEKLIPSVLDLASATQQSASGITMALGRALSSGTAGALSRYGIQLDKASMEAFKLGTASQRTAILVGKLANFTGAAAQEASTAAGRGVQFTNALGDMLEEIGKVVEAPLAATFQTATVAIQKLTPLIAGAAGKALLLGSSLSAVVFGMSSFVAVWPKLKPAFIAMKASALGIAKVLLPIIGILAGIVLAVGAVKIAWDGNLGGMRDKFQSLTEGIANLWDDAVKGLVKGINWLAEKFILAQAMITGMSPDMAYDAVQTFKADPGSFFTDDPLGGLGAVGEVGGDALGALKQSWSAGIGLFEGLFKNLMPDIASATEAGAMAGTEAGIATGVAKRAPDLTTEFFGSSALRTGAASRQTQQTFGKSRLDAPEMKMAPKTIGRSVQAFAMNMRSSLVSAAATFGNTMLSASGEMGGVINKAIEGAKSGGFFGAMGAVFADLVSRTESFKATVAHANNSMDSVVDAFEPLADAMQPLAGLANNLVAYFATQLIPAFKAMSPVMDALFQVTRVLTIGVLNVVRGIGWAWNKAVAGLQWVFEKLKLDGLAKSLGRLKFNLDGVDAQIATLHETTTESIRTEIAAAAAEEETAKKLKELNQQLSNVPAGFRVDLRRYQASDGQALVPERDGSGNGGVTAIFNIEALDLEEAAQKLGKIEEFKQFTDGAKKTRRTPFSVQRGGG